MTITQLEYVVAVATYKSFVAAAEKCFVTQPTLSMQIQKLEEELGVRLFDRNKHPIAITAIGEKVVAQAKEIIAAKNKVTEIIQDEEKTVEGNFRLAVIPTIAPYIVPAMLEDYVTNYPDVQLQIKEMETKAIIEALYNNELDAALVSTPLNESGTKEYPLFYEQFVCYYAKDDKALAKKLITPEDIEIEKIWLLNEGHCMRNQVLDLCSDYVKEMQAGKPYRYESSNVETLRKMVDRNGGMTVLPELSTVEFSEDLMENVRYFEDPVPVREISLITTDHFAKKAILQSLMDEVLKLVPEKMRVQKKNRKVLRIQSSKL